MEENGVLDNAPNHHRAPQNLDHRIKEKGGPPTMDEEPEQVDADDTPPTRTLEEKRRLFEEGREAILAEVPDDAKARFGQIYFAKWGKQALPVLVMNPYSIPPGATRKLWLDMFDNVRNFQRMSCVKMMEFVVELVAQFQRCLLCLQLKNSDRLANMSNLV